MAQQPSGYFVLNDILRCLDDEEEEEEQTGETQKEENIAGAVEAVEEQTVTAPEASEDIEQPTGEVTTSLDAGVIDKKLERVSESQDEKSIATDLALEAPESAGNSVEQITHKPEAEDADATAKQIEEEDVKEPERPKDPSPTPVAKAALTEPEKPVTPAPTAVSASTKPMTWASRLAASTGGVPRPVVPLKAATPPAPAQSRAPAALNTPAQPAQPTQALAVQPTESPATARKDQDGWQTAGESSKRQNRPQSMIGSSGEKESTSCYVKYVSDKVKEEDLRAALSVHGDITYFDINRQKVLIFIVILLSSTQRSKNC